MRLSDDDREALRHAKKLLENPSLAMKITNVIGIPIDFRIHEKAVQAPYAEAGR